MILAHSTHLKGIGWYEDGHEIPWITVTLATLISKEFCARISLGYCEPTSINADDWHDRGDEGVLQVAGAGERPSRLNSEKSLGQHI